MAPVRPEHARGALRGARAALFALAALLLAATAHLAAGGSIPAAPSLVLLVVPLAWGAVVLTARPRGRVALLVALGGAELGLHQAFMALAGPVCPLTAATMTGSGLSGMSGMGGHSGLGGTLPVCVGHPMGTMAVGSPLAPGVMLGAHVVATAATALVLAYGERLLGSLSALLSALLAARLARLLGAVVVPAPPVRPAPPRAESGRTPARVLLGSVRRRGPPLRTGVAVLA